MDRNRIRKKKKSCGLKNIRIRGYSHISWPWKHFFTSKVVSSSYLVIVNYLRSVGSMSSSLRVLGSCDGIVFFGAPLALQPCSQSLSTVATRLRRFHVFVWSVFPFVDFATYLV